MGKYDRALLTSFNDAVNIHNKMDSLVFHTGCLALQKNTFFVYATITPTRNTKKAFIFKDFQNIIFESFSLYLSLEVFYYFSLELLSIIYSSK